MKFLFLIFLTVFLTNTAYAGPALDRVNKTNTIRCGFQYWDGGILRNEETDELEGFIVELTNEIAKIGGVKIEWVGPIDWGNVRAELETGKIDAMCAGMWQAGQKSRHMIFSEPFAYQGVEAYVKKDEKRFGKNFEGINSSDTKIATIDSDNSFFIAESNFPEASRHSMPLGTMDTDMLLAVKTGKADVAFTAPGIAYQFMQANEGVLKRLSPDNNLRIFGNTYVVKSGEFQLMHFFETVLAEIENTGFIDQLIDKYNEEYPFLFIKKAPEYEVSK